MKSKEESSLFRKSDTKRSNSIKYIKNESEYNYNINYSVKPLNLMLMLFGMNKFMYKGNEIVKIGLLSKLYSLICTLFVISSGVSTTYVMLMNREDPYPKIVMVIYTLGYVTSTLTSSTGIFKSAFTNSKNIFKMMLNIAEIDKKLGIRERNNYKRLRFLIIVLQLFYVLINILHYLYDDYCDLESDTGKIFLVFEHITNALTLLQLVDFSVNLWINVTRYKILNDKLKIVLADVHKMSDEITSFGDYDSQTKNIKVFNIEDKMEKLHNKSDTNQNIYDRILYIMKIFDMIADNIQILNSCYGFTVSILNFFFHIIKLKFS